MHELTIAIKLTKKQQTHWGMRYLVARSLRCLEHDFLVTLLTLMNDMLCAGSANNVVSPASQIFRWLSSHCKSPYWGNPGTTLAQRTSWIQKLEPHLLTPNVVLEGRPPRTCQPVPAWGGDEFWIPRFFVCVAIGKKQMVRTSAG